MSKILPIGYTETKMGRDMAVFFFIVATAVSVILVKSGMEIKNTVFLFCGAAVLAFLFILTDVSTNKKNKEQIAHMKKMLACPSVVGNVVEIKKYHRGLGGKLKEIKPDDIIAYKNCVYKIIASCINAENNEIIVESEIYVNNPKRFLKGNRVRVYYSSDNEYWIDVN